MTCYSFCSFFVASKYIINDGELIQLSLNAKYTMPQASSDNDYCKLLMHMVKS